MAEDLIVALDIGTSRVRSHVYDGLGEVRGEAWRDLELLRFPSPSGGRESVELEPQVLWEQVRSVLRESVDRASESSQGRGRLRGLGIATQRNTFLSWDGRNGRPFHRFVAWNDPRSEALDRTWNSSWTLKAMHLLGSFLYFLTRSGRWLAASIYRLVGAMVTMRLMATIKASAPMREALAEGHLVYGCIESWLLCRLSGGGWEHSVTEIGLASATGMFDPFRLRWGLEILRLLHFPTQLLPEIRETVGDFGRLGPGVLEDGEGLPILAVMGDQMAAVFGCGCWEEGEAKLSLGTGTFLDVVLRKPHASMKGFIPILGWQMPGEAPVHLAEGFSHDTASALNWAHSLGIIPSLEESGALAESVEDSGGVFFVSAFSGIQVPVNDETAATLFIGISARTGRAEMVRALLEAVAFRAFSIWAEAEAELGRLGRLRVCGGVSRNAFVLQTLADLSGVPVERMGEEATSRGVAFAAGLRLGVWQSRDELAALLKPTAVFQPRPQRQPLVRAVYKRWLQAQQRSLAWHPKAD